MASFDAEVAAVHPFFSERPPFFSERIPATERVMAATSSDGSFLDLSSSSSDAFSYLDQSFDELPANESHPVEETGVPSNLMQPLYEGADVTVIESSILLLQFSLRHSLSTSALKDLIQLLTLHLPKSSQCSQSKYKLKKLFTDVLLR